MVKADLAKWAAHLFSMTDAKWKEISQQSLSEADRKTLYELKDNLTHVFCQLSTVGKAASLIIGIASMYAFESLVVSYNIRHDADILWQEVRQSTNAMASKLT